MTCSQYLLFANAEELNFQQKVPVLQERIFAYFIHMKANKSLDTYKFALFNLIQDLPGFADCLLCTTYSWRQGHMMEQSLDSMDTWVPPL